MKKLWMIFIILYSFSLLASETYLEYSKRINANVHVLEKGERIEDVLKSHGAYKFWNPKKAVNLLLWKNGIRSRDKNKLPPGTKIVLPYMPSRKIASTQQEKVLEKKIKPINNKKGTDLNIGSVSLNYTSIYIKSVDLVSNASAELASDVGIGVTGVYTHVWNTKWSTSLVAAYKKINFAAPSGESLIKSEITKTYYGASLTRSFLRNHRIGLNIGIGQSLILVSSAQGELGVDPVNIPAISIAGDHTLFHSKDLGLGAYWRLGALAPVEQTNYSTKQGQFTTFGLKLDYSLKKYKFFSNADLTSRALDTNLTSQTSSELSVTLGLSAAF